jgi:hypothetical protein
MVWMCMISTNFFQLPSNVSDDDQKGWGLVLSFWEKNIHAPFSVFDDQKYLFAI